MATGLAEKQFTSGLQDLLASFGSKTKDVQTNTANTGPLESVIAGAQQPMNMELYKALIANIMQTAAQQVPDLSAALANATGSRTSNNSPLALAIAQLQATAANAGASKVIDFNQNQQQIAANAAGQLANATRTTTGSQTAGKPAVNPLATMLLGTLANQVDKRGGFDRLFGRKGTGEAAGGTAAPTLTTPAFMQPEINTTFQPTSMMDDGVYGPPAPSYTPSAEFADTGGADILGDFIASGFSSFTPDALGSDALSGLLGDSFSGSGLDIGGADLQWSPDEWWFADGGVIRNRNNLGGPIHRQGMAVIEAPQGVTQPVSASPGSYGRSSNQLIELLTRTAQLEEQRTPGAGTGPGTSEGASTPGGAINMASGNPLGANVGKAMAGFGTGFALGPDRKSVV